MSRIATVGGILAAIVTLSIVGACTGSSSPAVPSTTAVSAASTSSSPTTGRATTPASSTSIVPSQAPSMPSPSPVPIPPFGQTFRSPTMGYTVRYPNGWTVFKASERWLQGTDDRWDAPNGDRIESRDAGFRGGSQPLLPGQTAQAWIDAYMATQVTGCGEREEIRLAGTLATIGLNGCRGLGRLGGRVYDVVLVKGGRAYNFTMEGAVDHPFLLAILATIKFDASSAVDRP
jgi:hypothetical protein